MIDDETPEEKAKKEEQRRNFMMNNFNQEQEAIKRKSHTSFGKLILATEKTSPIYSIGQAPRFGSATYRKNSTPGPTGKMDKNSLDYVTDPALYKWKTSSKWRIGKEQRFSDAKKVKYDYYKHIDNFEQEEKNPKTWKTRIIGGDIGLDARVKYDLYEKTPGPGRYENTYRNVRPKSPAYFIAEKTGNSAIKQLIGTPNAVGPGKYRVESAKFTSKHRLFPIYSIGKQKRQGLFNINWTKNETYDKYSSMGNQHMSKKRTEPRAKIGKSTRDRESLRGTFSTMMDRQPMRVNIPMPKC